MAVTSWLSAGESSISAKFGWYLKAEAGHPGSTEVYALKYPML